MSINWLAVMSDGDYSINTSDGFINVPVVYQGDSIISTIEAEVEAMINNMTIDNGFNFDWQTTNQVDAALCQYPRAIIEATEEENVDPVDGAHSGAYSNVLVVKITCEYQLTTDETNPKYAINDYINRMLDDLKILFATNNVIVDYLDNRLPMQYKRFSRIDNDNGEIHNPKRLETFWEIRYTQSRTDPTLPGD